MRACEHPKAFPIAASKKPLAERERNKMQLRPSRLGDAYTDLVAAGI